MEAMSRATPQDGVGFARELIRHEAEALLQLASGLNSDFGDALLALSSCRGAVVVTGMGKAGLIGRKITATLCSTGTRSHFLHPAEAVHGDLGSVSKDDWVLALSMSGETEELTRVVPTLNELTQGVIAITSKRSSSLAQHSAHVIELGTLVEVGVEGLAPSTSTTAMLAIGDALALTISEQRGFGARDFVRFHPGGSLGRRLTPVREVMRTLTECRVAKPEATVRETFVTLRRPGRRTGAVMIVQQNKLVGIFTDSDLARLLENQSESLLESPVQEVMTKDPLTIQSNAMLPEAIQVLAENQISELPVVDDDGHLVGMVDITDVIHDNAPDENTSQPVLVPFPQPEEL